MNVDSSLKFLKQSGIKPSERLMPLNYIMTIWYRRVQGGLTYRVAYASQWSNLFILTKTQTILFYGYQITPKPQHYQTTRAIKICKKKKLATGKTSPGSTATKSIIGTGSVVISIISERRSTTTPHWTTTKSSPASEISSETPSEATSESPSFLFTCRLLWKKYEN